MLAVTLLIISSWVGINRLMSHCLATPTTGFLSPLDLHETGTLHTTWRYSDRIAI